ncbi:unnamed protein product [Schistosoma curassoni]|uniref:Secreted protein n=1 Tax=Schistosoma curassoni TaxID=6186 RepID=A0A183JSB4_9TREM|nr:unnamed protein product [Schistosoma curassoni]
MFLSSAAGFALAGVWKKTKEMPYCKVLLNGCEQTNLTRSHFWQAIDFIN